jgi:hypothetical protein
MRSHRSLLLIAVLAAALTGCASAPPKVEEVGEGAYHVAVTGTAINSQADVNYRAVLAANDYCAGMNKEMLFRQSTESGEHAWSSKREDLTFVCMSAKDPSYFNAGLRNSSRKELVAQQ